MLSSYWEEIVQIYKWAHFSFPIYSRNYKAAKSRATKHSSIIKQQKDLFWNFFRCFEKLFACHFVTFCDSFILNLNYSATKPLAINLNSTRRLNWQITGANESIPQLRNLNEYLIRFAASSTSLIETSEAKRKEISLNGQPWKGH